LKSRSDLAGGEQDDHGSGGGVVPMILEAPGLFLGLVIGLILGAIAVVSSWFFPERTKNMMLNIYGSYPDFVPFKSLLIRASNNGCLLWWVRIASVPFFVMIVKAIVDLLQRP
jgi:hypothetical protein